MVYSSWLTAQRHGQTWGQLPLIQRHGLLVIQWSIWEHSGWTLGEHWDGLWVNILRKLGGNWESIGMGIGMDIGRTLR